MFDSNCNPIFKGVTIIDFYVTDDGGIIIYTDNHKLIKYDNQLNKVKEINDVQLVVNHGYNSNYILANTNEASIIIYDLNFNKVGTFNIDKPAIPLFDSAKPEKYIGYEAYWYVYNDNIYIGRYKSLSYVNKDGYTYDYRNVYFRYSINGKTVNKITSKEFNIDEFFK